MNISQRVWHYLSPNATSRCPSSLMFVDVQSREVPISDTANAKQIKLRCWSAIYVRLNKGHISRYQAKNGNKPEMFWRFLRSKLQMSKPLWLWSYNSSTTLTMLGFGEQIELDNFVWEQREYRLANNSDNNSIVTWQGLVVLEEPPTIIELRYRDTSKKVIVVDTLNYWSCNLSELARSLKQDYFDNDIRDDDDVLWQIKSDYNVITIKNAITKLIKTVLDYDLGNFRYTASAQGLQAYRHRFMDHKILVHCDELALKLERQSYFGGICQLKRYGLVRGPIYVFDVQSFYPSIMSACRLPYHWLGSTDTPHKLLWDTAMANHYVIATVTLKNNRYGFPTNYAGQTVLAHGSFKTTLSYPELQVAKFNGDIDAIHEMSWYKSDVLFKRFVDYMWDKRCELLNCGNTVQADMVKLIMNGAHGKLGQRQIKWIDCPHINAPFPWGTWFELDITTGKKVEYRSLNWRVQRKRKLGEPVISLQSDPIPGITGGPSYNNEATNSCPSISSGITSWGRVILHELVQIAGEENVYYLDTDCLHVNYNGCCKLIERGYYKEGILGKLSIKAVAKEAEYRGIKHYRLDDDWTIAGVKNSARHNQDGTWTQSEFSGWSSLVAYGTDGIIDCIENTVDRSHDIIPGVILPDGTVTPITIYQ